MRPRVALRLTGWSACLAFAAVLLMAGPAAAEPTQPGLVSVTPTAGVPAYSHSRYTDVMQMATAAVAGGLVVMLTNRGRTRDRRAAAKAVSDPTVQPSPNS